MSFCLSHERKNKYFKIRRSTRGFVFNLFIFLQRVFLKFLRRLQEVNGSMLSCVSVCVSERQYIQRIY